MVLHQLHIKTRREWNIMANKMDAHSQELLNLCAVAAQNEHLIVSVGKFAINMALSPKGTALGLARNIAGLVYSGIAAKAQGNQLAPPTSPLPNRKVPAADFIQNEMDGDQKQRLINRISKVLGNKNQNSFKELLSLIVNDSKIRRTVLREVKKFLESENMSCSKSRNGGCCCNNDDDSYDSEEYDSDYDDYYDAPACSPKTKRCCRY